MPAMKDSNIVKIAVEMGTLVPQLIEFNQNQPLAGIIQELCNGWQLSDPEQYALQFNENNNRNYITEKNRNEIKNGQVLRLEHSPSKTAQDILHKLNGGNLEEKTDAMKKLSTLSADMTFALDFINKQGLALIIRQIEGGKCETQVLAHTLLSFVELMEHGIVSWDILDGNFITRVASLVTSNQEAEVTQAALSILENVVLNSTEGYGQVEREVPVGSLVVHLKGTPVVQQNAVALINALLLKADHAKRRAVAATLTSKQVRQVIQNNIIQTGAAKGAEMAHQLYVLLTLTLGLLEQRMMTKMDPQARRLYSERFPTRHVPDRKTLQSIHQRLHETGKFKRSGGPGRPKTATTVELEENVLNTAQEDPGTSTRKMENAFNVSNRTIWKIFKQQCLYPYHIQRVQALTPSEFPSRIGFC